ncbi:unnamed protein product [Mycena citricolor]|uniref:MFS general substrate transporter n=1 Tax=Mycena citricolor TaxID=2018698 RepID=A0AAD2H9L7_9AGAR|nr:unnamed protein product [Mycena citricolor]
MIRIPCGETHGEYFFTEVSQIQRQGILLLSLFLSLLSHRVGFTAMAAPAHADEKQGMAESKGGAASEREMVAFPEGGMQAWATVFGVFIIQFCGFGYSTAFGVFQDFYVRDYLSESSASAISWIGSMNGFLGVASGLLAGPLYDRGHFRLLIYSGCALQAVSIFLLSVCQKQQLYQIFLTQGVLNGLGVGIAYIPSVAVISHYFQRKQALVMALVAVGSPLGALAHPILLNNTLHTSLGFANSVRISAGINTFLLLVACALVQPRLKAMPEAGNVPIFIGRMRRDWGYVCATIAMPLFSVAFWYPLFFIQLDAVTHGMSQNFAFYAVGLVLVFKCPRHSRHSLQLVIFNGAASVGRLAAGPLASWIGILEIVTFSAFMGSVLIFGMISLKTVVSVVMISIVDGFFAGVVNALLPPMLAYLTDDPAEVGLRMGVSFSIEGIAELVGVLPSTEPFLGQHWRHTSGGSLLCSVGQITGLAGAFLFLMSVVFDRKKHRLLKLEKSRRFAQENSTRPLETAGNEHQFPVERDGFGAVGQA